MAHKEMMHAVMSPIASFIEEQCELGSDLQVSRKDLYATYTSWCAGNGVEPRRSMFRPDIAAFRRERNRPAGADRSRRYMGIALRLDQVTQSERKSECAAVRGQG